MKLGPNQERWLAALESGNYRKGIGKLNKNGRFCCLGVACELFACTKDETKLGYTYDGKSDIAPGTVIEALSLRDSIGSGSETTPLVSLNDKLKLSFEHIASKVRSNPEAYFTGPS